MAGPAALLVVLLTVTLAAFGGIYAWALPGLVLAAVLLAVLPVGPAVTPAADTRALDLALGVLVGAVAVQLIPLPAALRSSLSPHLADVESVLRADRSASRAIAGPLSVNPLATSQALALLVVVTLTYRTARRIFSTGGVRQVCRALGMVGIIACVEALVQRAVSPTRIYGFWQPLDVGAQPFGPVVNRNHFAAWLLMASAVTAGYAVARVLRRVDDGRGRRTWRQVLIAASQSTVLWTIATGVVMTATLVLAQSRSALLGAGVATVALLRAITRSWTPVAVALVLTVLAVIGLIGAGETTTTRLAGRFAETLEVRDVSRVAIWRETLPMVADFGLTGVGAGAFSDAMLTYQQTRAFAPHLGLPWHFNQAHNHYLQLAAEGGALVGLPFLAVVVLFLRLVRRRIRDDRGELRTVRLGALAGLAGVATQSVWEVPLTMPAAALLAATLAALATYRRAVPSVAVAPRPEHPASHFEPITTFARPAASRCR